MKKALFGAMLALAGVMIVGCASNKVDDPVAAWQAERCNAAEIAAANEAARPLTLEDVTYKSTIEIPTLAAPINALAMVSATLYLKVVTEVDQLAANQRGRLLQRDVAEAISMGEIADPSTETIKAWIVSTTEKWNETCEEKDKKDPEAEWKYYVAYLKAIDQADQESVMNDVVKPLLAKLAEESAKVAATVAIVKSNPEFAALGFSKKTLVARTLSADGLALSTQFADATAGANHWLTLLMDDKKAKDEMKGYSVE